MQFERFHDLRADAHNRVERGAWLLKNIADSAAAQFPQFALGGFQNVAPIEQDAPGQPDVITKADERRFLLGIAYEAGRSPRIKKGTKLRFMASN